MGDNILNNQTIFRFPPLYNVNEKWNDNYIKHLIEPSYTDEVILEEYKKNDFKAILITSINKNDEILLTNKTKNLPNEFDKIIRIQRKLPSNETYLDYISLKASWLKHPKLIKSTKSRIDYKKLNVGIIRSWHNAFRFNKENIDKDIKGLRLPQAGAIHNILGHWTVSNEAATIVMPTGTGKTEVMISILVSEQCKKLLVIVPTNALRIQISDKLVSLGILKEIGVVDKSALYPVVGILRHKPKNIQDVDCFFSKCNVIVATMKIASECQEKIQYRMAKYCPYLFIDEAHHLAARQWKAFKKRFGSRKILQFTATPFRNDEKEVGGKIIFNYPLKKAQEDGYLRTIQFSPVREFDFSKADEKIAIRAVEQLSKDCKRYRHVLMARVDSIKRANEVFLIYEKKYPEFNPVQIHTGIKSIKKREKIRRKIINGESRIVICVDMLGEGFDLPELKIAAFHDIRKSLPVTLQLAGRFIRARSDLGEPTFIANIADINVHEEIQKLYSQDADWSSLLGKSSQEVIQKQIDFQKFIEGFSFPQDIPIQNLRPAMSTVIYRTECQNWMPEKFINSISNPDNYERIYHGINPKENTLVIISVKKVPIDWARMRDIYNWDYELLIVFWDKHQSLLFIHSSTNSGYYRRLAEAVAGRVELIKGSSIFRCFSKVNRLKFQNIGLIEQLGRLIRYTMRAGSDVEAGLTDAQKQNVLKSNFFGVGYEDGSKTSIGCTYKGRIWSRRVTNIEALTRWCSAIGKKVIDESINPNDFLKGTLIPKIITGRPKKMPICIDWPEVLYRRAEDMIRFIFDGKNRFYAHELDIELLAPSEDGAIKFMISADNTKVELVHHFIMRNNNPDFKISTIGTKSVDIRFGSNIVPIEDFLYRNPPTIWFVDGSSLEGNTYVELSSEYAPYDKNKITAWDWTGINIKKESQGLQKIQSSIQFKVIESLKQNENYEVIFDDDGKGEIADIVAIATINESIIVELYHCKFSRGGKPGVRVEDLFTVCGQAQKGIHWKEHSLELFNRLLMRESERSKETGISRFEKGNNDKLFEIKEKNRYLPIDLKVFIVQPGLSKNQASNDQLRILGVTENYLMETYKLPFGVIASE